MYNKFFWRFFRSLAILIVIILLVFITPIKNSSLIVAGKNLLIRIVYPFQYVVYKSLTKCSDFAKNIITLRNAQKENERLRNELLMQRAITNSFIGLAEENVRLKKLLNFKNKSSFKYNLIAAEVIARSPSFWFNNVIIDKGENDGIKKNMAVINEDGLVGKVTEVYPNSSKVLLLIAEESSISVIISRTKEIGVVVGNGPNLPKLKYIFSTSNVVNGDFVETSGISEYFPKSIPVGKIKILPKKELELFYNIEIIPSVDFNSLRNVFVIK